MQWLLKLFGRFLKSNVPEQTPYSKVNSHLAQSDIFSLILVAPLADDEIRILRTESGLHGTHVFSGEPGYIFDHDHLVETIKELPEQNQLQPFHNQGGLPLEKVVVFGDLVEYFMIASQTCDISGVNSDPKVFAVIVPVIPLAAFLSRERLRIGLAEEEIDDETKWTTIADYLEERLEHDFSEIREDAFALPKKIREVLGEWNPAKNTLERRIRGKIRDTLKSILNTNKKYIYYLPQDSSYNIPEGWVDFTKIYTVETQKLNALAENRVCTLSTPYREQFSEKLGTYLSRIATPASLIPPSI